MKEITKETAYMLKRYFINASPFLWGLLEAKKKKVRIKELKGWGFLNSHSEKWNPVYEIINQELLAELGIDGIIERIVIPQVNKRFNSEDLITFRRYWELGRTPDINYLRKKKLYARVKVTVWSEYEDDHTRITKGAAYIFLDINPQEYVDRWTVFAGLWFEIIEPLIETANKIGGSTNG
jgi:hypothetical protein